MGGYSYQDIESRLKTVESQIEFVMKSFSVVVQNPLDPYQRPVQKTLLDVYRDVITGATLNEAVQVDEVIDVVPEKVEEV